MIIAVLIICIIVFLIFLKLFKKADYKFYEQRKDFIAYLDSINDFETLKQIGEINFMGVREKWYPKYTNVIPYLEKKIEENNDTNFIKYLIAYEEFIKKFMQTMPFIVLSIMIPLACIVSIFCK